MIWAQKKNIFHRQNNTPIKNKIIFSIFFPWHSFPPQLFFKEKKVIRIILCDDELFEFKKKYYLVFEKAPLPAKKYQIFFCFWSMSDAFLYTSYVDWL